MATDDQESSGPFLDLVDVAASANLRAEKATGEKWAALEDRETLLVAVGHVINAPDDTESERALEALREVWEQMKAATPEE